MRAAETGRPVVQAAISGISAIIDANGVVHEHTQALPAHGARSRRSPPRPARRPYVRYGEWAIWARGARIARRGACSALRRGRRASFIDSEGAGAVRTRRPMSVGDRTVAVRDRHRPYRAAAGSPTMTRRRKGATARERALMTEPKDRIEHTLEVLVYAPIGVGLYLKDMGPDLRQHVRRAWPRRGRPPPGAGAAAHHDRAKSIGQVAMTFGVPMVRQRVEREVDSARQRAQSFLGAIGGSDGASPPRRGARRAARRKQRPRPECAPLERRGRAGARRDERRRPVERASEPAKAADLDSADSRVRRALGVAGGRAIDRALARSSSTRCASYEGSHRKRRTILGKIDQISV